MTVDEAEGFLDGIFKGMNDNEPVREDRIYNKGDVSLCAERLSSVDSGIDRAVVDTGACHG